MGSAIALIVVKANCLRKSLERTAGEETGVFEASVCPWAVCLGEGSWRDIHREVFDQLYLYIKHNIVLSQYVLLRWEDVHDKGRGEPRVGNGLEGSFHP